MKNNKHAALQFTMLSSLQNRENDMTKQFRIGAEELTKKNHRRLHCTRKEYGK